MDNILKVTKYQLRDFRKPVMIYYLVITALGLLLFMAGPNGESSFGGATFIFIFILGLNSFKSSFKFMQANNISRRTFYFGNIGAIIAVSTFMSLVDLIIDKVFTATVRYKGFYEQIYIYSSGQGFLPRISWNLTLLMVATSLGFMITVLYYRSNKVAKILISLVPAIGLILFSFFNRQTDGRLAEAILSFLGNALGLTGGQNPYMAMFSFIIAAIGVLAITYGLIFKAPIKD